MSQRIHEYLHQRKLAKDTDKQSLKSTNSDSNSEKESITNIFERLKPDSKNKSAKITGSFQENENISQFDNFFSASDKVLDENLIDSFDNLIDLIDSSCDIADDPSQNQTILHNAQRDSTILLSTSPSEMRTSIGLVEPSNILPAENQISTETNSFLSRFPQLKIAFIPIGILLLNHILNDLLSRQFLFGLLCGITLTAMFFVLYQTLITNRDDQLNIADIDSLQQIKRGTFCNAIGTNSCCTRHNKDYIGWWPNYSPCASKYPNLVSWNDLPRPNIPETQKIPILPPEITTTTAHFSATTAQGSNENAAESIPTLSNKDFSYSSSNPFGSALSNQTYPNTTTSDRINYLNTIESCSYLATGLSPTITQNGKVHYKGWMNMVNTYNPYNHRLNMTKSVFILLEETTLKIFRPKRNIPRRAMWNESAQTTQPNMTSFVHQHTIDMKMSKVALHPVGIVKKRYWSKKYPIYIAAKNIKTVTNNSLKENTTPLRNINPESLKKSNSFISTSTAPSVLSNDDNSADCALTSGGTTKITVAANIYLFGRTDREKESWYRRLYAASIGKPLQIIPSLAIRNFIMKNDSITNLGGTSDSSQSTNNNHSNSTQSRENRSKFECPPPPGSTAGGLGPTIYSVKNDSITIPHQSNSSSNNNSTISANQISSSTSVNFNNLNSSSSANQNNEKDEPIYVEYIRYMAKCMPADWLLKSSFAINLNIRNIFCDDQMAWLNALIGRIFWDFFREDHWLEKVKQRIQNKLNKIKVPPFIDPLTVVSVELGNDIPVIRKAAKPFVDTHGVWFELEFVYAGSFALMLETKINLMKSKEMKRESNEEEEDDLSEETRSTMKKSSKLHLKKKAVFISDEEDSAETTTDSDNNNDFDTFEEVEKTPDQESVSKETTTNPVQEEDKSGSSQPVLENGSQKQTKKAIYRLVDKFAKSTLVQNKVILKGIDYMSKTPLKMRVDVFQLSGTVVLNLPPPPSDRLWFGFRPCPQLKLKAKPQIGVMNISVSRILEWIENKLMHEFERVAVLPNMLDFRVPLLVSDQIDSGPSPFSNSSTSTAASSANQR